MKKMSKTTLAVLIGAICLVLVIGGVVGAVLLSGSSIRIPGIGLVLRGSDHLRDSYKDAGKAVIIAESPVIIEATLDAVDYDGSYTTLTFLPGEAMKGSYDEAAVALRFSGDYREKSVNPTPQPEFTPGGSYYLFLQRNNVTGEITSSYGFAGIFRLGEDGSTYTCVHHTARWQSFTKITLFIEVYVMPPLRSEIAPTASPPPTPRVEKRAYPTVPEITPSPTPTRRSQAS